MKKDQTIIIGAGPGGSSAAIYLARYNHPVIVIDAPKLIHGRTAMASTLENYLSHTSQVSGPDFMEKIKSQLKQLPIKLINEKVIEVRKNRGNFLVKTDKGSEYIASYLIIAVGFRDIGLKLDGLDPYYDNGIFHCITCDWWQNRKRKIAVISNDDAGIDLALEINGMAKPPKLIVVPSENKFKYSKKMLTLAKKENIKIYSSPLAKVIGKGKFIKKIILENKQEVDIDVLFTHLGRETRVDFLEKGIKIKKNDVGRIIVNFRTLGSSVKNLYAVGPCNNGPDQAIIAAGQGAMAALHIHTLIRLKN